MVANFDNIKVMFYDKHGIAFFYQFVEEKKQFFNVLKMQTCGRFVENVKGFACIFAGKLSGKFYSLSLTPRKRSGGLPQSNIAQAYFVNGFYFRKNTRLIFKKIQCLLYGHIQHICNRFSLETNFQSFPVVAFALTIAARDMHIG